MPKSLQANTVRLLVEMEMWGDFTEGALRQFVSDVIEANGMIATVTPHRMRDAVHRSELIQLTEKFYDLFDVMETV